MRSLLFKKERIEIEIGNKKNLVLFSKMWKKTIYKIEKIREKTKPCLILISASKNGETKLFHTYYICLLIK